MAALRRLWQEARSARFALLAFVAALLTSAGWLGYFVRTEEEGLVEALVLVAIPVLSTAGALALRRSRLGRQPSLSAPRCWCCSRSCSGSRLGSPTCPLPC
jgi:hypothetical protein